MNPSESQILDAYKEGAISLNETLHQLSIYKNKINNIERADIKSKNEEMLKLNENIMKELRDEIDSLIGLDNIKNLLDEIQAYAYIQSKRKENQLISEPIVLHMIFKGNPGTGKTTVARIVGKMFKGMGLLKEGQLIEIDRSDLVGEYIGHTATKVKKELQRALGGVLFIDEAYSLARGGEKDFGKEAIDYLVKAMEDYKDELILILAGYSDEMEIFLESNPGLKSRFPIVMNFKDYNIKELLEIAHKIVEEKQYNLSDNAVYKLKKVLLQNSHDKNNGNARLVRNIVEKALRKQALRLQEKSYITKEELMLIEEEDIQGDEFY